ncbi:MAG: di-heme oxidoredictase family protein, partial [Planctomycetota bacterium]
HDMGRYSMDLTHAVPYVKSVSTATVALQTGQSRSTTLRLTGGGCFGSPSSVTTSPTPTLSTTTTRISNYRGSPNRPAAQTRRPVRRNSGDYTFFAPRSPSQLINIVSRDQVTGIDRWDNRDDSGLGESGYRMSHTQASIRVDYESTLFNQEWRTPPLWGVADTAPYLHDGRASTLLEAITLHGGEAEGTTNRFLSLPLQDREAVIAFLETLVAPENAPQPSI